MAIQGVEALLPERPIAVDPGSGLLERFRLQPATPLAPFLPRLHDSRSFQRGDVLQERGQGHGERTGEGRDGLLSERKPRQDGPPRGVGQGREGGVQGGIIVNHAV
jgi:hypothetical protein